MGGGVLIQFVVVRIVRFQLGEWIGVRKTGGVCGTDDSMGLRERTVWEGESGVECSEWVDKN